MVAAATGRVHQVHHLDAAIVVQFPVEDITACIAHRCHRRWIVQVIIRFSQSAGLQVLQQLLHAPFGLSQKNGIGVGGGFVGVQHGGDPAEDYRDPSGSKAIGNCPPPFDLGGQHHGDSHHIGVGIEIDGFQVLVDKGYVHIVGQSGRKNHRAVGGEMKFGLIAEFGPTGVDQGELHGSSSCDSAMASTSCRVRV
jgi:hypothetical protein